MITSCYRAGGFMVFDYTQFGIGSLVFDGHTHQRVHKCPVCGKTGIYGYDTTGTLWSITHMERETGDYAARDPIDVCYVGDASERDSQPWLLSR